MEFDELLVIFRDRAGGNIGKFLGQISAQIVRADFDVFVGG
jgi:hypothetical protein